MHQRFKTYIQIFKDDIGTKGLYWSIIHRLFKVPYGKRLLSPLVDFLKPSYVVSHGNRIFIDKTDQVLSLQLILTQNWEPYETKIFLSKLKKGNVVVDIGAHIGYYTLLAAQAVGKTGTVFAFEPDPKNFALLKKNVKSNGYSNIVLMNKAVSNKTKKGTLFLNPTNSGDNRIVSSNENRSSVQIDMTALDDFFTATQKVDLIKMDIQGHELSALQGAKRILATHSHLVIFTEFSPELIRMNGNTPLEYLLLLQKNKFLIKRIDEIQQKLTPLNSRDVKRMADSRSEEFNLLCVRNEA